MTWNLAGLSVGIVIGAISGLIILAILRTLAKANTAKAIVMLVGELTGLVAFIVGAHFLGSSVLFSEEELPLIRDSYLVSLAATIVIMMTYPIFRWIVRLGEELGESRG